MAKILFLSNHFITLYSFRKEIIKRMIEEGHDVYLSLPASEENEYFKKLGCQILVTPIQRRGINPIKDLRLVFFYCKKMWIVKPDIIFSFTIKPNIYGSIASRITRNRQICNVTGTGATFIKNSLIGFVCKLLYRVSIKYCYKVYFQNVGDQFFFQNNNLINENSEILPGSGVNLDEHPFMPLPSFEHLNFIFIGRIMKLKGIEEYLECARVIHQRYNNVTFYVAGWYEEPIYAEYINKAHDSGIITYIGFRKDIKDWISHCHCIIHPAYGGEGISNVMLECASMGRICIASDIYGCREVVDDNISGFLFKKGNVNDMVSKVEKFISLADEDKILMGRASRNKVEHSFNRQIVVDKYLDEINTLNHV